MLIEHKFSLGSCRIHVNRVPDVQFEFGGFGWSFLVWDEKTSHPKFGLKIKCFYAVKQEEIERVYELGLKIVKNMIDRGAIQSISDVEEHFYRWTHENGLERRERSEISPDWCYKPIRTIVW